MDCTFERDLCSYVQDTTDEFDWEIGMDALNGPQYDHTTGSGKLFSRALKQQVTFVKAIIIIGRNVSLSKLFKTWLFW